MLNEEQFTKAHRRQKGILDRNWPVQRHAIAAYWVQENLTGFIISIGEGDEAVRQQEPHQEDPVYRVDQTWVLSCKQWGAIKDTKSGASDSMFFSVQISKAFIKVHMYNCLKLPGQVGRRTCECLIQG